MFVKHCAPRTDAIHSIAFKIDKRFGNTDGCSPNKRLLEKGCKLISQLMLMLCPGHKKISITKGNNSYIMQKRVMVLAHCTYPHRDLSNYEVSS